jgi:hypothetical protein
MQFLEQKEHYSIRTVPGTHASIVRREEYHRNRTDRTHRRYSLQAEQCVHHRITVTLDSRLELKVQAARLWKDLIRKSRSSINGSNLCHHRYHRRRLSPLFGDLGWI